MRTRHDAARWFPARAGLICLSVASVSAAVPARAETVDLPPSVPAVLLVYPRHCDAQPAAVHALVLPWILRGFQTYEGCAGLTEQYAVLAVEAAGENTTIGVARGKSDLHVPFEKLRGPQVEDIEGHDAYALRRSPFQVVRLGPRELAEGSPEALGLFLNRSETPSRERRLLAVKLQTIPAVPAAASLLYVAAKEEASLVQILGDFDAIWPGLSRVAEPYAMPLKLVGSMRGGRADVWQAGDSLRVRVLLVFPGSMDARRSLVALRTARGLAPMASDAAVRGGTLSPGDAELLTRILESMRTRLEDESIHVELTIPAGAILSPR